MRRSDFDYDLPPELIAQHPLPRRSASRLLVAHADGRLDDAAIDALPDLLAPGDLLVFNDTRVIKARLFGRRDSGGRIEILVERIEGARRARVHLRASHKPKPGARLSFGDDPSVGATVVERVDDLFVLNFDRDLDDVLETHGRLPLPPYIEHAADASDHDRYQTVWARVPGAVAAPTAGLHFDDVLLARLRARGIATAALTLHVGAGTFLPVRVDDLAAHVMHEERYAIDAALVDAIAAARRRGGRVVAVGTTSLRALESAADDSGIVREGSATTRLFIVPGHRFRVVDRLVTNFHLPQSTLLMLVSAFAGMARIRAAYAHAIAGRYRFFSYGDAMLIEPSADARPSP